LTLRGGAGVVKAKWRPEYKSIFAKNWAKFFKKIDIFPEMGISP